MSTIIVTTHEFKNMLTCMLKRYIKIGKKFLEICQSIEMLEGECIRIEIVDSEFKISL